MDERFKGRVKGVPVGLAVQRVRLSKAIQSQPFRNVAHDIWIPAGACIDAEQSKSHGAFLLKPLRSANIGKFAW
jgi:hypothetical protein